jgi:hypothetical protein
MTLKTLRAAVMAVAITGGLAAFAQPASATTVLDFDDLAGPAGGGIPGNIYTSQGYRVSPSSQSGGLIHYSKNHPYSADPGGATLIHTTQNMHSIFERIDGGLFDFLSIDVSNYYNNATPLNLLFTFTDSLGVVTTQTYRTDTVAGLETITFNRKDLSRFTMNSGTDWVQFDNVVLEQAVSAVPEPATWAMMLVGFFAAGGALRASRRTARTAIA